MSDRSLDEFVTPSEDATSDGDEVDDDTAVAGDAADAADAADADDDPTDATAAAEAATPTMRWSNDPVACDACGAAVRRRWRATAAPRATSSRPAADDDFVCADCKEW